MLSVKELFVLLEMLKLEIGYAVENTSFWEYSTNYLFTWMI